MIDLTNEKFENRFKGSQERDTAWKFLSSIAKMFDEVAVEEDNKDCTNPDATKDAAVPKSEKGSPEHHVFDNSAVLEAIRKEQTMNDNSLLDDDATRMTNDRLEQPIKDEKVKEDDTVSKNSVTIIFWWRMCGILGQSVLKKTTLGQSDNMLLRG